MNNQVAVNSYSQVHTHANVETASPHKLIDMLYEGALQRITQARGAMQFKQVEAKGKRINQAISIVGGLRENLNLDQGGEIAENLDALYFYIQGLLAKAHVSNDDSKLEEASNLLLDLRGAWKQIG